MVRVGRPIDEERLVVLRLVLDIGGDLLDRLCLKGFLSVGTKRAGNTLDGLAPFALAPDERGFC